MHVPTGEIKYFTPEFIEEMTEAERKQYVPLTRKQTNTLEPMSLGKRKNWMRNQPCVCGSGKKFKKCCWSKYA